MKNKKCSFCEEESGKFNPVIGLEEKSVYICTNCNNNFHTFLNQNVLMYLKNINNGKVVDYSIKEKSYNDYETSVENKKQISLEDRITIIPKEIKSHLDKYVIKQDEAKKSLAIAVYQHYKRLELNTGVEGEVKIDKSNVMLIGPSGSGKTLLIKTLSEKLDLPLVIADATSFTQAGYVGDDVENILIRLLEKSNNNKVKAERGIVFIDEIDKIAKTSSNSLDIGGEGVQQALLKMVEGSDINIKSKKEEEGSQFGQQEQVVKTMNTENILFVFSGSFPGLEDIIAQRIHKKVGMGFGKTSVLKEKNKDEIIAEVSHKDLIKYGLIPEFVGRIPNIVTLNKLKSTEIKQIIIDAENSIYKQYKRMFKSENIELVLTNSYIDGIITKIEELDIGARGIKSIMEADLKEYIFDITTHKNKTITL